MTKQIRLLMAGGVLLVLVGCQDPFPEGKEFSPKKPPEPEARGVLPYTIEVPGILSFREGQTSEYTIKAHVPAPGVPVIEFLELPTGAQFLRDQATLSWTPDFSAANNENDPQAVLKQYTARVRVSSSLTPESVLEENLTLWVVDVVRSPTVSVSTPSSISEGQFHEAWLSLSSVDFPAGPYAVSGVNLPEGMKIEISPVNFSFFLIHYTPSFKTVTSQDSRDSTGYYKDVRFSVSVTPPRGPMILHPVTWRVRDVRQTPRFSGPSQITSSRDLTYSLSAEDPNGEAVPQLTLEQRPNYGQVQMSTVPPATGPAPLYPFVAMNLGWFDIPPGHAGSNAQFVWRACAQPSSQGVPNCATHTVAVTWTGGSHLPPVIDRANWSLGEVKDLSQGTEHRFGIDILDGETNLPLSMADVVVEVPASNPDVIEWDGAFLKVTSQTPGIRQFNLKATSEYGVSRTEGMAYRVLPREEGVQP